MSLRAMGKVRRRYNDVSLPRQPNAKCERVSLCSFFLSPAPVSVFPTLLLQPADQRSRSLAVCKYFQDRALARRSLAYDTLQCLEQE